ncbi:MAG: EAL domain-containing protein [Vicinamibacterales bacterium]
MLLVDDDESSRALLRHRLEGAGYEVTGASGHEALAYLDSHDVSIVLLDAQMPQAGGLEVLRAIRGRWTDAELPVLLVTTEGRAQDVASALELGANDYITTAVDFHIALARIRTQLARKDAEERLHSSEERYKLAADGANDGIWDWNLKTDQLYYSTRWKAIVGCSDEEVGTGPDEWFGRVHPEDLPRLHHDLDEHLDGRSHHFEVEHRIRHKSGAFRWVLTRGLAVRDTHGRPIRMAGSQADVTDGKIVDALTGLPNRVLLVDRLDRMLSGRRRQEGRHLAVLFLDLDGFKMVNDGMGHFYGDELLQAVAVRLRQSLRLSDTIARLADDVAPVGIASGIAAGLASEHTIARLGGDEFVVLLHEVRDVVDATNIADRIHKALSAPFDVGGRELFTNASIGIALESPAYHRAEELLRDADTAMYRAKALGKGRSEVFDAEMREQVIERRHLDKALRLAVERREFVPFFQPIVDLSTGKLSGFESLIRWRRPGHGIVGPGDFVPLLLENRLIVPVGRRFFGDVCQLLRGWQEAHPSRADLRININFAGPQFNEVDLLDRLIEMLDNTGLSPASLVVEVTESTVIADFHHAGEVLNRIRDAGFLIVLDDFGTGYSSLSCLEHLPICGIKLDSSFIARQSRNPVIMKAVVSLAQQLGLTVTAEGIETAEQCELMRRLGCGFAQGYLFGRPEPAESAGELIERNPEWFACDSARTPQLPTPAPIVVTV